ncbi:MAG TPA: BON domain-containing protein [Vicinamibacterales bacterium]|nr:BON domain-containing protein [Vicinamibacterales bacterium]
MRFIRTVFALIVFAVIGVLAYNYWSGHGLTLRPAGSTSVSTEAARDQGKEIVDKTAATVGKAATKIEEAVDQGSLTLKIKSKMALDDLVKARTINVDTTGSVVTLTGTVESSQERERAVRLARETAGVANVVDKLQVKNR